ncbi:MAG: nucleoside-triphosphatase [Bacteroidota bacterium]|nr:nucleoside-triphosphatase [Bacteroidota bacterium]
MQPSIYVVTGKVQGGKTCFLTELVELLKKRKILLCGFLCPGTFDLGERSGFRLKNVETGKEVPMASVKATAHWVKYRKFWFNPEAFKHGKEWIRECLRQKVQIIVIDEVGPMELEGSGWSELLEDISQAPIPVQLWSVRENLLEDVIQRWNIASEHILHIDKLEVEQAVQRISGFLANISKQNHN